VAAGEIRRPEPVRSAGRSRPTAGRPALGARQASHSDTPVANY